VHALTVGVNGWAMHEPLRTGSRRSAAVLDRVVAVGADADAAWFPTDGLVHLDLHTDKILAGDDGTLTGIIMKRSVAEDVGPWDQPVPIRSPRVPVSILWR
jgi:hypothetical protein